MPSRFHKDSDSPVLDILPGLHRCFPDKQREVLLHCESNHPSRPADSIPDHYRCNHRSHHPVPPVHPGSAPELLQCRQLLRLLHQKLHLIRFLSPARFRCRFPLPSHLRQLYPLRFLTPVPLLPASGFPASGRSVWFPLPPKHSLQGLPPAHLPARLPKFFFSFVLPQKG